MNVRPNDTRVPAGTGKQPLLPGKLQLLLLPVMA